MDNVEESNEKLTWYETNRDRHKFLCTRWRTENRERYNEICKLNQRKYDEKKRQERKRLKEQQQEQQPK